MENIKISFDPETEFLHSKRETGNEWELFKENVKPMKRGRNVHLLNNALKSQIDNQLKKSLLDTRRKLIVAIDEYNGGDPLQPWLALKIVIMLESYIASLKQTKYGRNILFSLYLMLSSWNQRTRLQLQMRFLAEGYLAVRMASLR
ncbi:hypothetical protein NMG60_11008448 [Bertholletia excelsa]